jgi:hypothetical protein
MLKTEAIEKDSLQSCGDFFVSARKEDLSSTALAP